MKLPPAIQAMFDLLRSDALTSDDAIAKAVKAPGLRHDLTLEALRTEPESSYETVVTNSDLSLQASAGLHPALQCTTPSCRHSLVRSFAQMAAVYSDVTAITDRFTSALYRMNDVGSTDWTSGQIAHLAADLIALQELDPLVQEGIVRFTSPFHTVCAIHDKPTMKVVDDIAARAFELFSEDAEFETRGDTMFATSSIFGEESIGIRVGKPKMDRLKHLKSERGRRAAKLNAFKDTVVSNAKELAIHTVEDCRGASEVGAIVISTGQIEALTTRAILGRVRDHRSPIDFSAPNRIDLPWVSDLTTTELLELRERTSPALRNFRLELTEAIRAGGEDGVSNYVKSIKQQLPAVDGAIRGALAKSTGGLGPAGILAGFGLILTGAITANPLLVGMGAPVLGGACSIWNTEKTARGELETNRAKPSYVLISAREILSHRHK